MTTGLEFIKWQRNTEEEQARKKKEYEDDEINRVNKAIDAWLEFISDKPDGMLTPYPIPEKPTDWQRTPILGACSFHYGTVTHLMLPPRSFMYAVRMFGKNDDLEYVTIPEETTNFIDTHTELFFTRMGMKIETEQVGFFMRKIFGIDGSYITKVYRPIK